MIQFSNPNIILAAESDLPSIKDLLNNSYRGEVSKQGWTTEADLIDGDTRADDNMLLQTFKQSGSVFLLHKTEDQFISGCVNLQQIGNKIYLGMFSVSPLLQNAGIGKQILRASEEYTRILNCQTVYMTVISVRTELIDWYKRHGYIDTGERQPFIEDGVTGKHRQELEFMVLEKKM